MTENEQALISVKKSSNAFSVNRKYINSKLFRDKFEALPLNPEIKAIVYHEVGRLLEYVDGQENEYLIALDYFTGKILVDNFSREAEARRTGFSESEYKIIMESGCDLIVIHNHSYNGRPSAKDMITFHDENKIKLSIIACHSGELYVIYKVSDIMKDIYRDLLSAECQVVNDMDLAKRLATAKLYQLNDRICEKKKLFDVRRL